MSTTRHIRIDRIGSVRHNEARHLVFDGWGFALVDGPFAPLIDYMPTEGSSVMPVFCGIPLNTLVEIRRRPTEFLHGVITVTIPDPPA